MTHPHEPCPYRPLLWKDIPVLLETFQKPILRLLNRLDRKMSALDDVLSDLDAATNEVASKIDAQTAKIADLSAQLAAALPGSEQAAALQAEIDNAVTAIGAESSKLHGLAADPANPVPEPPADNPPADTPPADQPPADTPPVDSPPADTPPAG